MAGPWITDVKLRGDFAALLHVSPGGLEPIYDVIIPEALQAAADDITLALMARGYSVAQIDAWDQRATFNRDLGLFWALTKGGILRDFPDLNINKLDRRKELADLLILSGGVPAVPSGTVGDTAIGAMSGRFTFDERDRISMDTVF